MRHKTRVRHHRPEPAGRADRSSDLNDFVRSWWIPALVIFGGMIATVLASRHLVVGPIQRLADAAREISVGHRTHAIAVTSQDELGHLTASFNAMVASLSRRTDELKRSNDSLNEFAHVASHDLQEPLRSIAGFMQLLQNKYSDVLDEKGRHYVDRAISGAERMQGLMRDLLAYSRISSRPLQLTRVDCNEVMDKVRQDLERSIEENGAVFKSSGLPTMVADSGLMERLFLNLISNAIKFRGAETPVINYGAEFVIAEGAWRFYIQDNGIGIESKFKDRVFQSFQRLHGAGQYPGSGIGLSIAVRIVDNHGGRIWFESEPGHGTTFYFTIAGNLRQRR